jgi:hypothetical protein
MILAQALAQTPMGWPEAISSAVGYLAVAAVVLVALRKL